jgi:serine/threonine-protein phosphatase PGAM5
MVQEVDDCHDRIEEAFQKYMYRANLAEDIARLVRNDNLHDAEEESIKKDKLKPNDQHEFEVIVCHGNLIRYFFCRALQLPPEAWLRMSTFNCSLTYLMIKPTGDVTCRMLGDIGHLGPEHSTFSMKHGFAWS